MSTACRVDGCDRSICAKELCRLHWERQHKHGTTDAPPPRRGPRAPGWKGDAATYTAVHLRMSSGPRPAECASCGTTEGRFEWALRPEVPTADLMVSPEGYRYSPNQSHYVNLCKPCHAVMDQTRSICKRGHLLSGDNLYVQPSNGARFCRQCQTERRRQRTERERAPRFGGR